MIKNHRKNLVKIIYNDLYSYGKIQLFLLLLVIISGISVVLVTYKTRCMISNREEFISKKYILECERSNLLLKKEILSNHARIEDIAMNKLHMLHLDPLLKDELNN